MAMTQRTGPGPARSEIDAAAPARRTAIGQRHLALPVNTAPKRTGRTTNSVKKAKRAPSPVAPDVASSDTSEAATATTGVVAGQHAQPIPNIATSATAADDLDALLPSTHASTADAATTTTAKPRRSRALSGYVARLRSTTARYPASGIAALGRSDDTQPPTTDRSDDVTSEPPFEDVAMYFLTALSSIGTQP